MYSCLKVITPSGGTAPFTETVTGITDASTGSLFRVRTIILLGGNTAGINTLSYAGMTSSNFAGDSGYHWDWGFMHDTIGGSSGGGVCHDFDAKIASGASGWGYPFMDTWPDIFFGGYIAGYGYVTNVQLGSFDITWLRRDRSGDSKMMLCLGGTDYSAQVQQGVADGVISTSDIPQGILQYSTVSDTLASGPASTGAGGTGFVLGWSDRDNNMGSTLNESINQAGNDRAFWTNRFNYQGATVSSWGNSSYTVTGAGGAGGLLTTFMGPNVVVRSGSFATPTADADYSFSMNLNAAAVIFQTVGLPLASMGVSDTTQAQCCVGITDPSRSQASFWTGDTTVGNSVPLKGARYLSDTQVARTATANAASTSFSNIGYVTALDTAGDITLSFSNCDGTAPIISWFAIGTVAVPPDNPPIAGCVPFLPN